MSVLYRALWHDHSQSDPAAYLDEVMSFFTQWATDGLETRLPDDGHLSVTTRSGAERTISVCQLEGDAGGRTWSGVDATTRDLVSDPDGGHTVWTTITRSISLGGVVHTWVENQVESDDLDRRDRVGRPRVVDDLLGIPGKPMLGDSDVHARVLQVPAYAVPAIVGHLRSERRTLPVIVVSEGGTALGLDYLECAEKIARRTTGVATVVTLDNAAVTAFKAEMGDLGVWGGGIRTYAPVPVGDIRQGWRHRYISGQEVAARSGAMVDRVVAAVAGMSAKRRVPEAFLPLTSASAGAGGGGLSEEDVESERLDWELRLQQQVDETNQTEHELARKIGHLDRIKSSLEERSLHELFWTAQHAIVSHIPDEVDDTSEAILAGQTYLTDWLVIPDSAPRELDGIDSSPSAFSWGNKTWRGLRALAAFAEERSKGFQGSFWDWCSTGAPMCWPDNAKHLSMTESDSVQNNKKYFAARLLPVSTDVDPGGRVTMLSHLKIAEGGGDLAPRVYFLDDTAGPTKQVHVGFVGPHYLMPNTKS